MNRCEYCEYTYAADTTGQCRQCGAPIPLQSADYSTCPHCKRKLLALASLACNYCGKGLPADYIRTRQNVARTIAEGKYSPAAGVVLPDHAQPGGTFLSFLTKLVRSLG